MVADPTIAGLREVLDESLDEIRSGIGDLSVGQLNARPAGGDTNSIAVIVVHALGSTLSWLSLAVGAPMPPRVREEEFRTVADERFAARADEMIARCLAVLDEAGEWVPDRAGTPNWNRPGSEVEPTTAAWAAAHALAHLGEHVGHLHMTRAILTSS